jgi:hypothetical protein
MNTRNINKRYKRSNTKRRNTKRSYKRTNTKRRNTKRSNTKRSNTKKGGDKTIEITVNPNTSKYYTKNGFIDDIKIDEYYELLLNIKNDENESYFEKLKKYTTTVDSYIANIENKCNDWGCLSSKNPPTIKRKIKIKELTKESVAPAPPAPPVEPVKPT